MMVLFYERLPTKNQNEETFLQKALIVSKYVVWIVKVVFSCKKNFCLDKNVPS